MRHNAVVSVKRSKASECFALHCRAVAFMVFFFFLAATRQVLPPASLHGRLTQWEIGKTGKKKYFYVFNIDHVHDSPRSRAGAYEKRWGWLGTAVVIYLQLTLCAYSYNKQ